MMRILQPRDRPYSDSALYPAAGPGWWCECECEFGGPGQLASPQSTVHSPPSASINIKHQHQHEHEHEHATLVLAFVCVRVRVCVCVACFSLLGLIGTAM
jgi:hypothetical protein